jgi:hypothetical protein
MFFYRHGHDLPFFLPTASRQKAISNLARAGIFSKQFAFKNAM